MKPFFAAMQFLTVLPIPYAWGGGEKELGKSVTYFPLVGAVIGILAALLDLGLSRILPPFPASVMVVISLLAISGGLHLDGLADTADGFMSSRPKERILEIMKDSRTGPMGVAVVVCVLLLKVALLSSVTGWLRWPTIFLMPVAGRCALLIQMAILPYAKSEGGLGTIFHQNTSRGHIAWGLLVLLVTGILTGKSMGMAAALAAVAMSVLFTYHVYRKIGGLTGDTLGAGAELVELVPALVAAIWISVGVG